MKLITLDQVYDIWYKLKKKNIYNFDIESLPEYLCNTVKYIMYNFNYDNMQFGQFFDIIVMRTGVKVI